jgi:hypothetical protein
MFNIEKGYQALLQGKIISRGIEWGILAFCYVCNWSVTKGVAIELHKF